MGDFKCAECGKSAELQCSGCKSVAYCGKDHQKQHWKAHKNTCRPYEIIEDPEIGKCMVATRNLSPGDLILMEYPIVFGPRPHMVEEGPVPCPGCCRLVIPEQAPRCEGCDFPICSPGCPGLKDMDVHGLECTLLGLRDVRAINGLHDFYRQDTLLALRCLLLQHKHPKRYCQLLKMESHLDERGKDTDIYKDIENRVVNYLQDNFFAPMKNLEAKSGKQLLKDVSKETIHKICAIIDVNAMDINQGYEVTGVYPIALIMEHKCLCNTRHTFENFENRYTIRVRAAFPISKGEHITTSYTHILWGTQARRVHLKETKYFSCKCHRCADPTELGTYLSALRCIGTRDDEPCGGTQLPVNPLNDDTEWACDKCNVKLTNQEVNFLVSQIGEEVDNVQSTKPTVRELESLLTKMLTFLHPNHYHAYSVRHSLVQLYGYQQGYMCNQLNDDVLMRKSVMCRELLEITRKIDPVNTRLALYSGVLLHELYLSNMTLVKRKWDIKAEDTSLHRMLHECQRVLEEAIDVLSCEKNSPAGRKLKNLIEGSRTEFENFLKNSDVVLSEDNVPEA